MIQLKSFENIEVLDIKADDMLLDIKVAAPEVSYHFMELPQTTLHYIRCGEGPPLIMVPATVSKIENWLPLAQFMGQRFTTYFFELPGHGLSTPFSENFTTDLVAESVEAFINELGYEQVSLMGFSFGGILAMKSLYRLQDRIEKVILFAPALTKKALTFSKVRLLAVKMLVRIMQFESIRTAFLGLISHKKISPLAAKAVRRFASVEETIPLETVFEKIQGKTLEVLANQMTEVLNLELPVFDERFQQPCAFAMSVNDPMLEFNATLKVAQAQFETVHVERFYYPYHQLPETPTFDQLADQYGHMLDQFCEL